METDSTVARGRGRSGDGVLFNVSVWSAERVPEMDGWMVVMGPNYPSKFRLVCRCTGRPKH